MMSQMLSKMCLPCGAKDELMLDHESDPEFIICALSCQPCAELHCASWHEADRRTAVLDFAWRGAMASRLN